MLQPQPDPFYNRRNPGQDPADIHPAPGYRKSGVPSCPALPGQPQPTQRDRKISVEPGKNLPRNPGRQKAILVHPDREGEIEEIKSLNLMKTISHHRKLLTRSQLPFHSPLLLDSQLLSLLTPLTLP